MSMETWRRRKRTRAGFVSEVGSDGMMGWFPILDAGGMPPEKWQGKVEEQALTLPDPEAGKSAGKKYKRKI